MLRQQVVQVSFPAGRVFADPVATYPSRIQNLLQSHADSAGRFGTFCQTGSKTAKMSSVWMAAMALFLIDEQ